MVTIRDGVFETNSSSTHAIIIAREGTKQIDEVHFSIGEYGWECRYYSLPDSKASYFYTLACECLCRDVADDIVALLAPYGIECYFEYKPIFSTTQDGKYTFLDNGYVDHYSEGMDLVRDCLADASLLIDLIFNDQSYVETGNDNDDDQVGEEHPDCEYVEYYKGN